MYIHASYSYVQVDHVTWPPWHFNPTIAFDQDFKDQDMSHIDY